MSTRPLIASERLDDRLGVMVVARPSQAGAPPSVFAAALRLALAQTLPLPQRAARAWRWQWQHRSAMCARNN
jgi:hypothetical protein